MAKTLPGRLLLACLALMVCPWSTVWAGDRNHELAAYDALIQPAQRKHWGFQPVRRPPIPAIKDQNWTRNPIDAFVLSQLESRQWRPAPPATPTALLRRMYLDVIGLPPSLAEQQAALNQPTPERFDRLVEELLARPEFGERWGRHWLDVVRYADTNGYERDATKPNVWRYRDYVIRSFNQDKPFDRFILEQLAGDELPDASAESMIATGFLRLGPWDDEPADPKEDRFDQLDDLVSTTSLAFLGLTMGCARCHNHKFEPLTMHDYYRMVAIFDPLQRPQNGRTELDLPAVPHQRSEGWPGAGAWCPASALGSLATPATWTASLWLLAQSKHPPAEVRGYFLVERSPRAPATHLLIRGKATRPGPAVEPGLPAVLVSHQPTINPTRYSTGRRLTLARWIASEKNPLTARVIVNRVWQHFFGEGLVRTPSDFGTMGQPPTHPELLDYLADEFVRSGWSIKQLARWILTSQTYRMSRRWQSDYAAADPENRLLWRVSPHRLEVEAIRDGMLAASGRLNRKMYGPSMYPQVPREALASHSDPDKIWHAFDERESSRRTVYAFVKRSLIVPMLEVMDFCDTTRSSAQRLVTTVAPQALSLFNGDFVNRQGRHLAQRLEAEAGTDPAAQIDLAYRLTLCRPPNESERTALFEFLRTTREPESANRHGAASPALRELCRVLLNLNEFVYPD